MAEPLKSTSDANLTDQVVEAWRTSSTPPDLSALLIGCESSQSQLEILLVDMHYRWDAAIATDIESYLRSAPLVANDRIARLELLDRELAYRNEYGSQQQVQELIAAYPELSATQVQSATGAGEFDTVIDSQEQATPPSPTRVPSAPPRPGPATNPPGAIPSESFGRYEIIRLLGKGGFGTVYLAHDSQLGRQVAIKSLHKRKFSTDKQAKNFLQEARSTARLNHPSIVTLYDVAESSDGSLFAVMEYVDGDSLAGRLTTNSIKLADGIEILVQVAQALGYAHRRGFVHRDLKPGNILIDQEGRARVADFGLAIHEDSQRMRVGELAGTPAYMAPEQVRGETHRLDGRTDIWSLGVVLYEMLTGKLPFSGATVDELFDEILHRRPRPPRQLNRDTLPALDRICCICLSADVERRYGSAEDVAIELDKCLSSMTAPDQLSIASNPALVIGGLGLIGVGFMMSFVGGFFVWVTYMAMQWAFGGLSTTTEFVYGLVTFSVLSSPFFLGLPTMILGLWLAVVQGLRWRDARNTRAERLLQLWRLHR